MTAVRSAELGASGSGPASPPDIGPGLRAELLDMARVALQVAVGGSEPALLDRAYAAVAGADEPAAVFVTLTRGAALRGCVVTIEPVWPLRAAIVTATIDAALRDPRFRPVRAVELAALHLDASVLGMPARLVDLAGFEPGVDGVVVEQDGRRALLLPEVATELGWGAGRMLDAVCEKAGLPARAWRDERTSLSVFRTTRFGGPVVPAVPVVGSR